MQRSVHEKGRRPWQGQQFKGLKGNEDDDEDKADTRDINEADTSCEHELKGKEIGGKPKH